MHIVDVHKVPFRVGSHLIRVDQLPGLGGQQSRPVRRCAHILVAIDLQDVAALLINHKPSDYGIGSVKLYELRRSIQIFLHLEVTSVVN